MKQVIITVSINANEMVHDTIETWVTHMDNKDTPIVIVDNGSKNPIPESVHSNVTIHRLPVNLGALEGFHAGIEFARCEFGDFDTYTLIHDDLVLRESHWDTRMLSDYETFNNVGIAGIGGATHGVKVNGYREGFASNMGDAHIHGAHITNTCYAAVFGSYFMSISHKLLSQFEDFRFSPELQHSHFFDLDVCCESLTRGFTNLLVPIACDHLASVSHGSPEWAELLDKSSTDNTTLMTKNATVFKEKWKDRMPISINRETGFLR